MSYPLRETIGNEASPTKGETRMGGRPKVIAHQRLNFLAYEQTDAGAQAKQILLVLGLRAKHGHAAGMVIPFAHAASTS